MVAFHCKTIHVFNVAHVDVNGTPTDLQVTREKHVQIAIRKFLRKLDKRSQQRIDRFSAAAAIAIRKPVVRAKESGI